MNATFATANLYLLMILSLGIIMAMNLTFFWYVKHQLKHDGRTRGRPEVANRNRYIALNETGNVVITGDFNPAKPLPSHIENLFLEALSHLGLITRTISTTIDPQTGQPYSTHSHFALTQILNSHPLFTPLAQETVEYRIKHTRDLADQTTDVFFGLPSGGTTQRKMTSIYNSMLMASQTLNQSGHTDNARIGHLTLCCESIMGIPMITAVVLHISQEHCVKMSKQNTRSKWNPSRETICFQKDTYLFNSSNSQIATIDYNSATLQQTHFKHAKRQVNSP